MGIYFFYGDEDYLIDKELKKFRDKLDKNFSEMNYVVYDELTYTDLISVLRTQPMMFGKMMIVINTRKLFSTGRNRESLLSASLDDNQIKEIESALENNNDMLDIFFVEKYTDNDKTKKPDSRRKIYKVLSKYTTQNFQTIPTYKTTELSNIINSMAKEKKVKLTSDAVIKLIESKGNNLREYDKELEKLQLLAYPETTITKTMVEDMCSSNQDLFKLTDYVMQKEYGNALSELRQLLITSHPLEILVPLQTMLKKWIFIKLNHKTMSNDEIGQRIGMNPYAIKPILEKLKHTQAKDLVDLRCRLAKTEYNIKTGQVYSPEEELENAIIG